jgi:WS/DGAT/MGAT family acyltransferase
MEHPTNLMMVTGAFLTREPLDFERVRNLYATRLVSIRRFRQRVVEGTLGLGLPHWEDDPYFDVDLHLHYIALPGEGTREQFAELASDLASTPLDYTKPLWQVHVVDNVMGAGALIMRIHHCIGDGTALVSVIRQMLDHDPEGNEPDLPPRRPRKQQGMLESLSSSAAWMVQNARSAVGTLAATGIDGIQHPSHLIELSQQLTRQATKGAALVGHALTQGNDPDTPLKGRLSVHKRVAWMDDLTVLECKEMCRTLGIKINDLVVAAVAGAMRTYLLERDVAVEGLDVHAIVPVDLRGEGNPGALGNVFGLVFLALPIGVADPIERVMTVKRRMDRLKQSNEALFYYGLLNIFGMTPKQVEEMVVEFFAGKATTVLTNVVGPRAPLYLAGAEVESIVFWVPQSGRLGMGVSIFSYNGRICVGIITDAGLAPDPERLVAAFADEWQTLRASAAGLEEAARVQAAQRVRCVAVTRDGSACRNLALPGLELCYKHNTTMQQPA